MRSCRDEEDFFADLRAAAFADVAATTGGRLEELPCCQHKNSGHRVDGRTRSFRVFHRYFATMEECCSFVERVLRRSKVTLPLPVVALWKHTPCCSLCKDKLKCACLRVQLSDGSLFPHCLACAKISQSCDNGNSDQQQQGHGVAMVQPQHDSCRGGAHVDPEVFRERPTSFAFLPGAHPSCFLPGCACFQPGDDDGRCLGVPPLVTLSGPCHSPHPRFLRW